MFGICFKSLVNFCADWKILEMYLVISFIIAIFYLLVCLLREHKDIKRVVVINFYDYFKEDVIKEDITKNFSLIDNPNITYIYKKEDHPAKRTSTKKKFTEDHWKYFNDCLCNHLAPDIIECSCPLSLTFYIGFNYTRLSSRKNNIFINTFDKKSNQKKYIQVDAPITMPSKYSLEVEEFLVDKNTDLIVCVTLNREIKFDGDVKDFTSASRIKIRPKSDEPYINVDSDNFGALLSEILDHMSKYMKNYKKICIITSGPSPISYGIGKNLGENESEKKIYLAEPVDRENKEYISKGVSTLLDELTNFKK